MGKSTSIDFNASPYANTANDILDSALSEAIPYSEENTQFAIQAMQNFYTQSRQDTLQQAALAQNNLRQQYALANAQLAPIQAAGYNALDQEEDILGLPRFAAGAAAENTALTDQANQQAALQSLRTAGDQLVSSLAGQLSPQNLQNLMGAVNAGENPQGILQSLNQMGIFSGSMGAPTNYANPQLHTTGIGIDGSGNPLTGAGSNGGNSGSSGGGLGSYSGNNGSTFAGMTTGPNGMVSGQSPITSIMGNVANNLDAFSNSIYGSFVPYEQAAVPAYQQLLNSNISSQDQGILSALNTGALNPNGANNLVGAATGAGSSSSGSSGK